MPDEPLTPITFISTAIGGIAAALFAWTRILLHQIPDWKYKKQKHNLDIFEKICLAYDEYKKNSSNGLTKAKLEYFTNIYCGYYIHSRLIDLAFKSDSTIKTLETLTKLKGEIIYEEGKIKRRFWTYFPDKKTSTKWRWISFAFYVLAAVMFFGSLPIQNIGLIPLPTAIVLTLASLVPAWLCYETMQQCLRLQRLDHIKMIIKKHKPSLLPTKC
ncbi:hypothetical protein [Halomonas sp. HL-93]|uniref:hypothetical protein n=1 Tax=Halomonas sp. HL-93 TaxID=1666906 RepID=UPI0007F15968|nr:hypothetical protein [Halomonas sp. HL-93]SBR50878.1 hypothetical protein GA0071314_2910 [Halomonas sp. HL-93]